MNTVTHIEFYGTQAFLWVACSILVGCEPSPSEWTDSGAGIQDTAPPLSHSRPFADEVLEAPGASSAAFQDPYLAVNGVRGGGDGIGSTDVYSLAYTPETDNTITLRFSNRIAENGDGIDFVVFENPFYLNDDQYFIDPVIIELSLDLVNWVTWPHDYLSEDELAPSFYGEHWEGFAGLEPVFLHEEDHPADPFDPSLSGGDPFDLDDLLVDTPEAEAIRTHGFRGIRLVSAGSRINPDTNALFPTDIAQSGPDIDGVYGRYLAEDLSP